MGKPEANALKKLSPVGTAQYNLDKAKEKQERNGSYSNTRDKLTAEGATYYQNM